MRQKLDVAELFRDACAFRLIQINAGVCAFRQYFEAKWKALMWDFLKEQSQRLTVAASLLTLITSVVQSLLNKANPPIISLALFSVALVALCGWETSKRWPRRKVITAATGAKAVVPIMTLTAIWFACFLVLGASWGFVYRERILYSPLADKLFTAPRVLVGDGIAWQTLEFNTPTGVRANTLVGEVKAILGDAPLHVVVVNEADLQRYRSNRDLFIIDGSLSQTSYALNLTIPVSDPEKLVTKLFDNFQLEKAHEGERFLFSENQFLPARFLEPYVSFDITVPLDQPVKTQAQLFQMLVQFAFGVSLYYRDIPIAKWYLEEVLKDSISLPVSSNPAINRSVSQILKSASYCLLRINGNIDSPLMHLQLASSFAPADYDIDVALAYLLLRRGSRGDYAMAKEIIERISKQDDDGTAFQLEGMRLASIGQLKEAIEVYERALAREKDGNIKARVEFEIGIAYGRIGSHYSDIIKHMEEGLRTIQIEQMKSGRDVPPHLAAVFHVMEGFAWAYLNNPAMAHQQIDDALRLASGDRLVSYWAARAFLGLEEYQSAIGQLEPLMQKMGDHADPSVLTILAEALLKVPGRHAQAEQYLDEALKIGPAFAKPHRYKGAAVVERAMNETDPAKRRLLLDEARSHLMIAAAAGEANSGVYELLALIYDNSGDNINAEKYHLLACELDSSNPGCAYKAEKLTATGDLEGARQILEHLHRARPNDGELWLREGIIWYKAGRLAEAKHANEEAIRLDPGSTQSHVNLAFVLFDLRDYAKALDHFDQALSIDRDNPDPDFLAGKAIVLAALGRSEEAIRIFALAVSRDRAYLDCEVLRERNMWSRPACQAARPLIAAVQLSANAQGPR